MTRLWPRLRFGDGGSVDLAPVSEWDVPRVEAEWRRVSVKVEWLQTPGGRLDHLLPLIVTRDQSSERS